MKRLASLLLFPLAAGCTLHPYQPRPVEPAIVLKQIESRRLDSPELREFMAQRMAAPSRQWPPKSWNFETLAFAADHFNPELDLARRKWATAGAAVATASQRPNPALVLPFEYGTGIPDDEKPWTVGLGIDIPLETAGKRGHRIARANFLSESARHRIDATAWKVRSRLRNALSELHLSRQRSGLLQEQVETTKKIVQLLERRRREGAASGPEVDLQRALLAARVGERNAAKQSEAAALAAVAEAIGVPVPEVERIAIDLVDFQSTHVPAPDAETRRLALLKRPELLAALAEYEASQATLQLQVARQYPDLTLGPGYTWDAGARRLAFGASGIELPLFHRNDGPIAEAEAARNEAASAVIEVQTQILQEMDRALSAYRSAHARLTEADRLLAQERRRAAAVRRSFEAGQVDRLELTTAEQALHSHLLVHDEAVAQVKRAIAILKSALPDPRPGSHGTSAALADRPADPGKNGNVDDIQ